MWHLALDLSRRRVTALLAVVVAVLGGLALVTATGVIAESGLRSHLDAGRLAGADAVVAARQDIPVPEDLPLPLPERRTVPADVVSRLAAVPGVAAAVGDVSLPAAVLGAGGKPVAAGDPVTAGHGWSSTLLLPSREVSGSAPVSDDDVALDSATAAAAGARTGSRVRIVVAGAAADYRVTAVVRTAEPGVWFSDTTAAGLAGRDSGPRGGTVDLVGLRLEHGDDVRQALHGSGLRVLTGDARGDAVAPAAVGSRSLLVVLAGSMAGVVLMVVGFVVAAALAVVVSAMRPELSLLRAVGATPRQVRGLVSRQALVVSSLALVPGVALGYLLAGRMRDLLVDIGMVDSSLPFSWSPLPALGAAALMALTVHLAGVAAGWKHSRLPAVEAVAASRAEPRQLSRTRAVIGAVLIVSATALAALPVFVPTEDGAAATSVAGILAVIGLPLAGPLAVQRVARAMARRLPSSTRASWWLAVTGTAGNPRRATSGLTSLAMAVVFVLTYVLAQTTLSSAASRDLDRGTLADAVVTAPSVGGLSGDSVRELTAVPGVRAAVPVSSTTVARTYDELGDPTVGAASALVLGQHPSSVLDLGVTEGSLDDLRGDTAALDVHAAHAQDVGVGDQVPLVLGDGTPVSARVVALYDRGLGFGPVAVSADLVRGHRTSPLTDRVLLRTDGSPATRGALAQAVAGVPGATVTPAGPAGGADTRDESSASSKLNLATVVVLLAYLLLSIANRMVAATGQRREEVALLRRLGATPAQVRSVLRAEAGLAGLGALVAGLLLSTVPLALLGIAFLGRPWAAGPVWLLPAVAIGVGALAWLTTELPLRGMLRPPRTQQ
ncbi:putative ABC transport system permease protein [Motilibacter peucedani]|uniref:Putative ABC transport system permease protein n=1 Tax=Motilibacter peucedani TaxID=598650 RepID=A0A420XUU7_9ACTN|nr:ABC transporter permease [Motilibacter peucedani]RKS80537.1 putative ABC transport system permease protein [Motilibacter peucedani]